MSEDGIRLQKVLAAAGVASRRASEIMIAEGRVEVNDRIVTEQGLRVDPSRDVIRVDGSRIPGASPHRYLVLNKPKGVVSMMADPEGRTTLAEYLPKRSGRMFHVGRLDTDTEGLILLTNHGEFAHRLTHPSYEVPKEYLAQVAGVVNQRTLRRLQQGVTLDDGPVRPDKVRVVSSSGNSTLVSLVIHEGRNRIVRRLLESVGHPVDRLSRVRIGPVKLGQLKVGQSRDLTRDELGALLDAVGL